MRDHPCHTVHGKREDPSTMLDAVWFPLHGHHGHRQDMDGDMSHELALDIGEHYMSPMCAPAYNLSSRVLCFRCVLRWLPLDMKR